MARTSLSGHKKEVVISDQGPTTLIGERINATGRRSLSLALEEGNMGLIINEAMSQVEAGADIIDINVSCVNSNESVLLPKVVREVMNTIDVPLCFDSANSEALEAALRVYKGKALINSVTGEDKSLKNILPLVKDYGAAVIGLVIDRDGIAEDSNKRTDIACNIVDEADKIGIAVEDVIIDCLVQSVGINARGASITLDTIKKVKKKIPVNVTLGLSNCSFGLPGRHIINSSFISMAIFSGLNCVIADAQKIYKSITAADLLLGKDKHAKNYIEAYKKGQKIAT